MCKGCGKDIYTVVEVVIKDSMEPLHVAGVEDVICIETVISPVLVQAMLDPGVGALIEQLISNRSGYNTMWERYRSLQERGTRMFSKVSQIRAM